MRPFIPLLGIALLWSLNSYAECISGNCVNGFGTYTYTDGRKYVGAWKNGKKEGQGTYTWPYGDKYVGN